MGLADIGELLLALAALLFSMSGFAYLFGDSRLAKRCIVGAVILAVSAPMFEASMINLAKVAGQYADVLLVAFAIAVTILVLSKHGPRQGHTRGRKPTSIKRRIDE